MRRAGVNEVDAQPVEHRRELRKAVELCFSRAPVVAGRPVAAEILYVAERYALRPVVHRFALGPTCRVESVPQLGERGVGDRNGEGLDGIESHRFNLSHRPRLSAIAAQDVAAAEMNWSVPCGNPASKYGWQPNARERTNQLPSSRCLLSR